LHKSKVAAKKNDIRFLFKTPKGILRLNTVEHEWEKATRHFASAASLFI